MQAYTSNTYYQENDMKRTNNQTTLCKPILCGALVGLACALTTQPVHANDGELRAGAVIQVPFILNSKFPSFDPSRIRIGLTCQYANIEEDNITTTRYFIDHHINGSLVPPPQLINATVQEDKGEQVYGLEGNIFIEVFNNFNGSAELLGFYGNNDIQGALGGGYSLADGFFLDAKAMFPYSEIGIRFLNQAEIYGGVKTLGAFEPAKEYQQFDRHTISNDTVPRP
jgi:hypothetical protein